MAAPFDEIQFPWQISLGAKLGPTGSTDIIILSSGYEQRNANWALPRRKYDVSTGLKSDGDVGQLIAFFMARQFGYRAFRFKDWKDYLALQGTDLSAVALTPYPQAIPLGPPYQPMATTGSSTVFQLQKTYQYGGDGTGVVDAITVVRTIVKPCNYGTHESPLMHPDGTPAIPVTLYVSGTIVASSAYTVDYTTGLITFGGAPAATPTANFEFDVPCRFDTDDMSMTAENWNTNTWQNIPVIEVRL
jgi:uncharacterized protein (TIGR02217 family)